MVFEFDPRKSASNLTKHGIDFVDAQEIWDGPVLEIPAKQGNEMRYLCIGKIDADYWSAIITYRGAIRRIISVRPSTQQEKKLYDGNPT